MKLGSKLLTIPWVWYPCGGTIQAK